jgi:hypothetical protein
MTDLEFVFDEMKILGEGLLAYGTATLVDAGEGYEGEFFVSEIVLVDGQVLKKSGNGTLGTSDPFLDKMFERIASQIQNDKCPIGRAASGEWTDHVDGNAPASIVPALKPRRGMPMAPVGHNAASRIEYALSDRVYGASLEQGR